MFIQKLEILSSSVFIADSLWKEIHRLRPYDNEKNNSKYWIRYQSFNNLIHLFPVKFLSFNNCWEDNEWKKVIYHWNTSEPWRIGYDNCKMLTAAVGYKYTEKKLEWKHFVLTESTSHNLTVMEKSITLRTFYRRSCEPMFYSTAVLLSHQQSGVHFVLPAKYKFLCLVAGDRRYHTRKWHKIATNM